MAGTIHVAVLVGSLRRASHSRKLAQALIQRAPESLRCRLVEIGELPLYNEDLEQGTPPAAWSLFRSELRDAQAVLFVTPEYNRSIPGCLKNALDVGSRPSRQSMFDGKPAAVVSLTPGKLGGMAANHALRQTFVFLNMLVLQQPEAYISGAGELLGDDGAIKNPESARFFDQYLAAFERWINVVRSADPGTRRDFAQFLSQRQQVASDYVNGDARALSAIVSEADPATFFSPRGDVQSGASAVRERYETDAKSFAGGSTRLEILQSGASGDLGFWTGWQHAEVRMGTASDTTTMSVRVTEVFRYENGSYKLVHRHGDLPR